MVTYNRNIDNCVLRKPDNTLAYFNVTGEQVCPTMSCSSNLYEDLEEVPQVKCPKPREEECPEEKLCRIFANDNFSDLEYGGLIFFSFLGVVAFLLLCFCFCSCFCRVPQNGNNGSNGGGQTATKWPTLSELKA